MNRGVDHQNVFFEDRDREEFARRLVEIRNKFDTRVLAYCLMGNHFHLLAHAAKGTLSRAMHLAMTGFARCTNDRAGRDGPLFRGRFHSIAVETDAYLLTASRYIHLNPLDIGAGMVDYRWSSYGAYLGRRPAPDFLDTGPLMEMFGGSRRDLADFTEGDTNVFASYPLTPLDVGLLLKAAVGMQAMREDLPQSGARNLERKLAVLLLDQPLTARARRAVEEVIGPASVAAVRLAQARARECLAKEPWLGAALRTVLAALPPAELATAR